MKINFNLRFGRLFLLSVFLLSLNQMPLSAQELEKDKKKDESYKPFVLKLNENGDKYIRFVLWHQTWVTTNNLSADQNRLQLSTSIRRSRFQAYAQISPRFLIHTHWGLNSLTPDNLSALGNDNNAPQLFLHGAWTEFKILDELYIGGGIHYWNGLTRLASASTKNLLTLDQMRPFVHWQSLGITDQFARHLGIYAKGQIGKFDYRIAMNSPGHNPLNGGKDYGGRSDLTYSGAITPAGNNDLGIAEGQVMGNTILQGYFRLNFWEIESTLLPHQEGTYLGTKKVLGVGLGFFAHPNGMFNQATNSHENVFHTAMDLFLDLPTLHGGWTAYASVMNFNYGRNYMGRWAGTGVVIYGHTGYFFKSANIMPYIAYQNGNYEAFEQNLKATDIGLNYFINRHNAKVTLEYHRIMNNPIEGGVSASGAPLDFSQMRVQAHIYL